MSNSTDQKDTVTFWRPQLRTDVTVEHGDDRVDGHVTDTKANGQWAMVRLTPPLNLDGKTRHVVELVRDDSVADQWIELNTSAKIKMLPAKVRG